MEFSWISSCIYSNILLGLSRALLDGTLPLRYCSTRFARRVPFWTLPVPGHVAGFVAAEVQVARVDEVEVAGRDIHWVGGSGPGGKRVRLNRKNPSAPRGTIYAFSSTCLEEVALFWVH